MASLRQKLSRVQKVQVETVVVESSLDVQNLRLQSRDAVTGNWSALGADGGVYSVIKRGSNSGEGLDIPGLTVKNGVGRFAN